jgi:hypothetical protein
MSVHEPIALHRIGGVELARGGFGRPANSPGWGRLVATKSGAYVSERDPADHTFIEAGRTHVIPSYWLACERPELFKPADRRDTRTYQEHRGYLEHARRALERGRTSARSSSRVLPTPRHEPVLPSPRKGQPWRLPR